MKTEILGIEVEPPSAANHWRMGGEWRMDGHSSRGYHGLIRRWIEVLSPAPPCLLVGEGELAVAHFEGAFPDLVPVTACDQASGGWDVTLHGPSLAYGTIVCQAVLEHVADPVAAVRNMGEALLPGGVLLIHTHGPAKEEHRHPVDTFRFMRDGLLAMGRRAGLDVADLLWQPHHCFAAYRRGHG